MNLNSFSTVFEARERKFQTEKIFQGEDVDLVARITNDGVPQDLTGYSVTGYYQPTDYLGTDQASLFYSLTAEISQDKKEVIVHWTYDKDFGKQGYMVWALLSKDSEHVYPVAWKINLAHSPGYPAGETPEPIPQVLDFSQYELLNAPWLPLAGGTVTGNLEVDGTTFLGDDVTVSTNLTVNGKFKSGDIKVNDSNSTQVWIGSNAGPYNQYGAVAIGYNAKTNGMGVAIGTAATVGEYGRVAIGFGSNGTGDYATSLGSSCEATGSVSIAAGYDSEATHVGSMAFGYSAHSEADNAIQIGTYTVDYGEGSIATNPCYNRTPNSVQFFQHQVFQTTGNPTSNPSTSNLVLVKERAPWAVRKNEDISFLATDWSGNPDMSKINLMDIAVAVNKCVAAITGKTIPTGTLPSDTTVSHFILTDGTVVTSNLTEFDEWTVNDVVMNSPGDRTNGDARVESIVLGSGVTTLGHHAFAAFANLLSIDMSRATAITDIPARCFYQSPKLNTVVLPPNVLTLDDAAFGLCYQLRKMTIPASVTGIDTWTFHNDTPTLTFTGRTMAQIQAMGNYSWRLGAGATLVGTDGTITI